MSDQPTETTGEVTTCYRHPSVETKLRCSRCERPICPRCSTPAVVGQHCPECVGEARRTTPKVRSTMVAIAPAVVALIAINALVFLVQLASRDFSFTYRWAMVPPEVVDGEWWRLLTAMFLHSPRSIFHIGMNMAVLFAYGPHAERALGTPRFVVAYLAAGFAASAVSFGLGPCNVVGVGASGAIFGVVGMLLVFWHNRRHSEFVRDLQKNLMFFVGINLVLGFVVTFIDWRAHAGGLVAGLALGIAAESEAGPRPLAVQLLGLALVIGVGLVLASGNPCA